MLISCLLIITTLSTQLYGMKNENEWALYQEIRKTPRTQLKPCSCNPDTIGAIINFADKSNDKHVMAKLLYLCLPKEVIEKYIAPHLAEHITMQYKHNSIKNKCYPYFFFQKEKLNYYYNTNLYHHDGTYMTIPCIDCKLACSKFIMWKAATCRRTYHMHENIKMIHLRDSTELRLCALSHHNTEFYVHKKNNNTIRLNFKEPKSHYLFSNDNALIAFGSSQETQRNLTILNLETAQFEYFPQQWNTSTYSTSALCSAHHSPIFAIGTNVSYFNMSHLSLIKKEGNNFEENNVDSLNGIIHSIEFSPDDSRLLVCSYSKKNNSSTLFLWNTTNTDQTTLINTTLNCGSKAFFICNGERIITTQKNGNFSVLNGFTGELIKENSQHCIAPKLTIWSNNHKLIITAINDTIQFFSSETGEWLGHERITWNKISAIGLPADEKSFIIRLKDKKYVWQLDLYNQQQYNYFDFIRTKANIIQLYEILNIYNQNKHRPSLIARIKPYI